MHNVDRYGRASYLHPMEKTDTVIRTLRERRQALHLSQSELAERIGVSLMTVWRWELGRVRPHPVTRRAWVQALEALEAEDRTIRPPVEKGSQRDAAGELPTGTP